MRNLGKAREIIGRWVVFYNKSRLHAGLRYLTPENYWAGEPEKRLEERREKLDRARVSPSRRADLSGRCRSGTGALRPSLSLSARRQNHGTRKGLILEGIKTPPVGIGDDGKKLRTREFDSSVDSQLT